MSYDVIYADPPWSYYNDSTSMPDVTTVSGIRRPPYPVMGSEDIKKLNVGGIANENNVRNEERVRKLKWCNR